MDKNLAKYVDKNDVATIKALEAGGSTRSYGGTELNIGDDVIGTIFKNCTFITEPADLAQKTSKTWAECSDEEKAAFGTVEYMAVATNQGNIPVGKFLNKSNFFTEKYWNDPDSDLDEVEVAEGFDWTKVYIPSARTIQGWANGNFDQVTKGLVVVAKAIVPSRSQGNVNVFAYLFAPKA